MSNVHYASGLVFVESFVKKSYFEIINIEEFDMFDKMKEADYTRTQAHIPLAKHLLSLKFEL